MGRVSPSLLLNSSRVLPLKRRVHISTQDGVRSMPISESQCASRNCVHRPCPGAISRIRPRRKGKTRGNRQPVHCARGVPHHSDHSSPACDHVFAALHHSIFLAIEGIVSVYYPCMLLAARRPWFYLYLISS